MLPSRVPVRIVADNPHEYQAIADVLRGGQAGALVPAEDGTAGLVALVCPSGARADAQDLPAVFLGDGGLPVPAALGDVFRALEDAAARHAAAGGKERMRGGWRLNPGPGVLDAPDGRCVTLTETETRLLAVLFDASDGGADRDTLLDRVWGYRPGLDTHTLETHVYRLRQKIEADPAAPAFLLTTETGYRLA